MDNDKKLVKQIKQIVKRVKFRFDYRDISVMSENEGNRAIRELIVNGMPGFVGRGGATEMRCIGEYLSGGSFSDRIRREISTLSGFFPTDDSNLRKFCETYIEAISKADIMSLWGVGAESKVVHRVCKSARFTELHALEPYYFSDPWSAALEGKKILVVHPFKDSIQKQYAKRQMLFPGTSVLPELASLTCIQAVQSIAGEKTEYATWFDALEFMQNQIIECDFDVAIIGAGAYGLPLAAYCKKIGKQAIQMSGATQLLFGIKGKRWDEHSLISKMYNEHWTRPNDKETPTQKDKVEGGSYW